MMYLLCIERNVLKIHYRICKQKERASLAMTIMEGIKGVLGELKQEGRKKKEKKNHGLTNIRRSCLPFFRSDRKNGREQRSDFSWLEIKGSRRDVGWKNELKGRMMKR